MDNEKKRRISELLRGNPYPGRGIAVGLSEDGACACFAYFIMGRSANSRNRVLVREEDSLYTRPFDESRVQDPSLIIYRAARFLPKGVSGTNGDQTDTIYEAMLRGEGFREALLSRTFEPDAPNYTPRISALLRFEKGALDYSVSILKRDAKTGECLREYHDYEGQNGVGHLLHTYQSDGEPLPTFLGAPRETYFPKEVNDLADEIWDALDEENKIALYVSYINIKDGTIKDVLYNKYKK